MNNHLLLFRRWLLWWSWRTDCHVKLDVFRVPWKTCISMKNMNYSPSSTMDENTWDRKLTKGKRSAEGWSSETGRWWLYVDRQHLVRNKLKYTICSARKSFIKKALSFNKSCEVWCVIHRILKHSTSPLRIDPDKLNRHFSTTAERTTGSKAVSLDNIKRLVDNLADVNPSVASPFSLKPVSHGEVLKCITSLHSDCSIGPDIIPARFIKLVADHLADSLTHIINNCIRNSYFPRSWKIARVSPIPKVNMQVRNDEFRPISILPVLSKVFEKLVATQMSEFAEEMLLLHDRVSSFWKGHSTTTALLGIRDDIRRAMKKGEISLMVLTDFSKAFDIMCFKTTIQKFYKLGFSKTFLKWLLSYLSDRSQFIQIDDKSSRCMYTKFGIPQGSILGPLIFNLYVADLSNILPATTTCAQYADDTTLYSHSTVWDLTLKKSRWIRPSTSLATGHRTPTWPWTHPKQNQCFTPLVKCRPTTPSHHAPYSYQCKGKIWNVWNLQSFSTFTWMRT